MSDTPEWTVTLEVQTSLTPTRLAMLVNMLYHVADARVVESKRERKVNDD